MVIGMNLKHFRFLINVQCVNGTWNVSGSIWNDFSIKLTKKTKNTHSHTNQTHSHTHTPPHTHTTHAVTHTHTHTVHPLHPPHTTHTHHTHTHTYIHSHNTYTYTFTYTYNILITPTHTYTYNHAHISSRPEAMRIFDTSSTFWSFLWLLLYGYSWGKAPCGPACCLFCMYHQIK